LAAFVFFVTPAKAGVQALNGSRALRAISTANCGVLRPAPWVTFVSAKVTKTIPLERAK
jgi:hypothetical protein